MGRASDKVDYNEGNQAVLPISQNEARLSIIQKAILNHCSKILTSGKHNVSLLLGWSCTLQLLSLWPCPSNLHTKPSLSAEQYLQLFYRVQFLQCDTKDGVALPCSDLRESIYRWGCSGLFRNGYCTLGRCPDRRCCPALAWEFSENDPKVDILSKDYVVYYDKWFFYDGSF